MKVRHAPSPARPARGFSLIELLITLAVIAALSSIMFPAFARLHDMARGLMCQNNMRGIYVALDAFAVDQGQSTRLMYPSSSFITPSTDRADPTPTCRPQEFMALTGANTFRRDGVERVEWDGLGKLWTGAGRYVGDPTVFYCPSHKSYHTLENYADALKSRSSAPATERVYGNYHYWAAWNNAVASRGNGTRPSNSVGAIDGVLLTDGLRTKLDLNHPGRCNSLKTDGSLETIGGRPYDAATSMLKSSQEEMSQADQLRAFSHLVTNLNKRAQ
jgi:prepilin-type N-terminal cleavage/methylation domain-containing protein